MKRKAIHITLAALAGLICSLPIALFFGSYDIAFATGLIITNISYFEYQRP